MVRTKHKDIKELIAIEDIETPFSELTKGEQKNIERVIKMYIGDMK